MEFTVDTWIALGALVFSVGIGFHSIITSRRLRKLQEQVATYELKAHEEAEQWSQRADLQVRLERGPDQIVLRNAGGAVAEDIRLEVQARGGAPNPIQRDAARKLSLLRLDPEEECPFGAFVLWEHDPTLDIQVTWRDPDGAERRVERILYG
jgi:hypothetical protein